MSERMVSLQNEGSINAPRWSIMDENGLYYNDKDQSWGIKRDCTFYSSNNYAATIAQNLLLAKFDNKPMTMFVAPIFVHLYSDKSVTKKELQEWLCKIVRLATNNREHGNGPIEDSIGVMTVDWGQLKELDEEGNAKNE